jgi:hypothetical protein
VSDRLLWEGIRQALLAALEAIERYLGVSPTTAEIRRAHKGRRAA